MYSLCRGVGPRTLWHALRHYTLWVKVDFNLTVSTPTAKLISPSNFWLYSIQRMSYTPSLESKKPWPLACHMRKWHQALPKLARFDDCAQESGVRLASFPGSCVWDGNESGVRLAFSPTYIHQDVLIFSVEGIYPLEGWHHQSRTQSVWEEEEEVKEEKEEEQNRRRKRRKKRRRRRRRKGKLQLKCKSRREIHKIRVLMQCATGCHNMLPLLSLQNAVLPLTECIQ